MGEALKEFENMTGIKPSVVGSLRGLGTKSARVGLDKNAYIEIIAPDPKNSGPIGAALARDLEEGTLLPYHYAIRSSEVTEMKDDYVPNELGWQPDHISMFGASPNGTPKKWEMLYLYGHKIGGCVPFYIDWGQCDHPSASIPEVGSLKSLIVRAPAGHKVHDLLSAVSGIEVEEGEPMLEFAFGSPEGTITFSADNRRVSNSRDSKKVTLVVETVETTNFLVCQSSYQRAAKAEPTNRRMNQMLTATVTRIQIKLIWRSLVIFFTNSIVR